MGSYRFAKFMLWLNTAVWLGFGLGYAIAPEAFAALVDADISRADSYRVMADVGVMMIGIGAWYIFCALDDARTDYGLISALLICVGMLIGRLVGIAAVGSANGVVLTYLILEALDAVLLASAVGSRRSLRATRAPIT